MKKVFIAKQQTLFIIILNFNGGEDILACLKSLQLIKLPSKWKLGVLVVDNNVNPTSLKLRGVKILRNFKNLGFAKGMNVGIRRAIKNGAEAVLLLNQDAVVEKNFLVPLLENSADIVGPVIKFKRHGRWIYDFGGKINWWLGRTKHLEVLGIKYQVPSVDYVSGCAMMIKRPVLEKIGLLDERYFLYFEDADFCLRAKKAGFKVAVEPRAIIEHHLVEGKKKPLWQRWQLLKSNLIFINRWIPFWKKPIAYLYWWLLMFKILLR